MRYNGTGSKRSRKQRNLTTRRPTRTLYKTFYKNRVSHLVRGRCQKTLYNHLVRGPASGSQDLVTQFSITRAAAARRPNRQNPDGAPELVSTLYVPSDKRLNSNGDSTMESSLKMRRSSTLCEGPLQCCTKSLHKWPSQKQLSEAHMYLCKVPSQKTAGTRWNESFDRSLYWRTRNQEI